MMNNNPTPPLTIRDQSEDILIQASLAGRITPQEKRIVRAFWGETEDAMKDPLYKAVPGYLEREAVANEIFKRAAN